MKTTNIKQVCQQLAKEAGLFVSKETHIKLSFVDKDYFALSESEIIARFYNWRDCIVYLKGWLSRERSLCESSETNDKR